MLGVEAVLPRVFRHRFARKMERIEIAQKPGMIHQLGDKLFGTETTEDVISPREEELVRHYEELIAHF